jgi:translocation and assembly module TamB
LKKLLKRALFGLVAVLLLLTGLLGGAWIWSGSSTSLALGLAQVVRYLPKGQRLEVSEVTGSLRSGGHIGGLVWGQGALEVHARDVSVDWSLLPLWDGELQLGRLHIVDLRIEDRSPTATPMDTAPPSDLRLPLKVALAFAVDRLTWVGPPNLEATGLVGSYHFDSEHHKLDVRNVHIASGIYQLNARLQAQSPMALSAQLQGAVTTAVPGSSRTLTVQAKAALTGVLAGQDDYLQLTADLHPESAGPALQANLSAELAPWKAQPLAQVQAQWQGLNLASLWTEAPQTLLSGDAHVSPAGGGWQADLQLRNTASGPWDQQRLPLERLDAQLAFTQGQWALQSLQARGAGGRLQASGKASGVGPDANTTPAWQVTATAQGINTAEVLSRLDAVSLNGQLAAQQTPDGIRFDAQLKSTEDKGASLASLALRGLKIQTLEAKGKWQAPTLKLERFLVQTSDATLQGTAALDTLNGVAQGHLALTVPGGTALLDGSLASDKGRGELTATLQDATRTFQWLDRLNGLPVRASTAGPQERGELRASWLGGWEKQGASAGVALTVHAQAARDQQSLTLDTTVQGGRVNASLWQASVHTLTASVQNPLRPGTWSLALADRVNLNFQQSIHQQTLDVSAGLARLSGPAPGVARLQWQAARWAHEDSTPVVPAQWRTKGTLEDLPLGWLELLGQAKVANLGLNGDLVFGGQWDASGGDSLQIHAALARTSGDLQLQGEDGPSGQIKVGLRDARLTVAVDHDRVNAAVLWDSERGGQVKAELATQLLRHNGAWSLPPDAPLSGRLNAKLPPVGAWSMLAPPGWRIRGTLDANATLSGTLAAPQWRGRLQAQDLAVRSVVDGIDFSQGTLRANLDGQRLEIEEFKLFGAGGSSGGHLAVKGDLTWLPPSPSAASAVERLRIDLVGAAQGLRVSARADRRLAVSGQLSASLSGGRLRIGGALKADQALFVLPEDTAPRLGDDVRVRKPKTSPAQLVSSAPVAGVRVVPEVLISLDLGQNFEVRGHGLVTRLVGALELRSNTETAHQPRLTGQLRTVNGTYKAYDQELEVEYGVLRFTGAYDNPALDVLAIRPNLTQRVGVQISGTALAPVVRLYADPDLPDAEKLAWLVLGRSAANGGAEAAMLQQAAMALLGGSGPGLTSRLADSLGLDQVSVRGGSTVGEGQATGATVTLGKRFSRDFYVAYESSMAGTMGTLYILYDLSRRLTLRAQSGGQSAVDLIFTLRYD